MKMNSHARTFVKQVQIDLLALNDIDLFHTVHLWIESHKLPGSSLAVPEDTLSALGYTHAASEVEVLSSQALSVPDAEEYIEWLAPSPDHLRTQIADMDAKLFAQHVIPLAFHYLHATHPEWHEGLIFNAHLANHLRGMSTNGRSDPKDKEQTLKPKKY